MPENILQNVNDFRYLQRHLTQEKVKLDTFSLQEGRDVKVAVRGLHRSTDPEDNKKTLENV